MNTRIFYVEDFFYGEECVRDIARQIERRLNSDVHLHDKLTESAVEEFKQGDYDAVVSHLLPQSIRDSVDPDNRLRAQEHKSYRNKLNFITTMLSIHKKGIPHDYYVYGPYCYNFELLAQMRRHKNVPIVIFSGCDQGYSMCGKECDAFVHKSAGTPLLCETLAGLLDRDQNQPPKALQDVTRIDAALDSGCARGVCARTFMKIRF